MACQQKTLHPSTRMVEKSFDIPCMPFLFLLGYKENRHTFQVRGKKTPDDTTRVETGLRFFEIEFSKTLRLRTTS